MQVRMSCLLVVVALLLGAALGPVAAATPGSPSFERGVKAFQAGDHAAALREFLEARRAGLDTPGLRYNLGSTYYRLQRYAEAEREFEALARDPAWAGLAHFNLGLTAQRRGRDEQAAEHFARAHRMADEPKLRALAATALERLGRAPVTPRTSAALSLAGGFDSNVTLSPEAQSVDISDQSDLFVEALAAAVHRLSGTPAQGLHAHGGLHLRKYADLERYDQAGLRAGLSYESGTARWRSAAGGYLDVFYVDGGLLQQAATLDLRARHRLAAGGDLVGRYRLTGVEGGSGFRYLDGWQQRLSLEAGFALAPAHLRLGYEIERNDRADLQQGGEFFSYSPTRHSLLAALAFPAAGGWRTEARAEYRFSRYNDPHQLDGGTRAITREDSRYALGARASRRLDATWRLFVDYGYERNDSNLNAYDYGRHQLILGVEAAL